MPNEKQDLQSFLSQNGFDGVEPILDEKYHEFKTHNQKGWFIGSELSKESGERMKTFTIGSWYTGDKISYKSNGPMTKKDTKAFERKIRELQEKAAAEKKDRAEKAKKLAQEEWPTFIEGTSLYLIRKQIPSSYGARHKGEVVFVPCRDSTGTLHGYQSIYPDGSKYFLSGQRVQGTYHLIGPDPTDTLYICEGFATGCSTHMATGKPVVVAFYANNLSEVGAAVRQKYPDTIIIIAGDEDKYGAAGNAGRTKSGIVSKEISAHVVFPKFKDETTKPTDFNDLHCLEGLDAVRDQLNVNVDLPIPTEKTGFHSVFDKVNKDGEVTATTYTPQPQDLLAFFKRKHLYKIMGSSEICYIWNGKYFEDFSRQKIKAFAQRYYNPVCNNRMADEFYGIVNRCNIVDIDWFERTSQGKINFKNGVLDIKTLTLSPHSPEIGFKYVLDYDFDPRAECPAFDKMMMRITLNDQMLEQALLEFMAYSLSGDSCWTQKALVLEGSGSNGKSTFITIMRALAGRQNYTSLTLKDLDNEYSRQLLDGKLFNIAEETPSKALMDSSTFKNLVAGGEIKARQIYKPPYFLRNRSKLIFSCNELPESMDTTKAFFRRMILVPFRAVFDSKIDGFDPRIDEKLVLERSGIFNKVMNSYKYLHERGYFLEAKASADSMDEYRRDLNPVIEWAEQNVEWLELNADNKQHRAILSEMYDSYALEMRAFGYIPLSIRKFCRKLKDLEPHFEKRYDDIWKNGKSHKGLTAVRFTPASKNPLKFS